jgi:hypothetical protein
VPGLILAAINPDNTPHGYNLTFAFPMLLFIVIGVILYALFSRPHRRVPNRPISVGGASTRPPEAGAARAAAVAGGLSLAPGGGTTESHLEPTGTVGPSSGAHLTASVAGEDGAGDDAAAGEAAKPGEAATPREQAPPEGTEGTE